jgi:hypothetical protein
MIDNETWIKEIKKAALAYGYEENTLSVVNSWCNEIFALGCDLLNAKMERGNIVIFARATESEQEITLKIQVELMPELPRLSVTVGRYVCDDTWTYRTFLPPYLCHFLLLARKSGMFTFA